MVMEKFTKMMVHPSKIMICSLSQVKIIESLTHLWMIWYELNRGFFYDSILGFGLWVGSSLHVGDALT